MVQYLNYNDEKIPVKIAFRALKNFQEETGKNMTSLDGDLSFKDIESLFWWGYESGCKSAKSEGFKQKYKRSEMEDILDEVYLDFVNIIPAFFVKKK